MVNHNTHNEVTLVSGFLLRIFVCPGTGACPGTDDDVVVVVVAVVVVVGFCLSVGVSNSFRWSF